MVSATCGGPGTPIALLQMDFARQVPASSTPIARCRTATARRASRVEMPFLMATPIVRVRLLER